MGKLQKIISFDFDDTLCMEADGSPNIAIKWRREENE